MFALKAIPVQSQTVYGSSSAVETRGSGSFVLNCMFPLAVWGQHEDLFQMPHLLKSLRCRIFCNKHSIATISVYLVVYMKHLALRLFCILHDPCGTNRDQLHQRQHTHCIVNSCCSGKFKTLISFLPVSLQIDS